MKAIFGDTARDPFVSPGVVLFAAQNSSNKNPWLALANFVAHHLCNFSCHGLRHGYYLAAESVGWPRWDKKGSRRYNFDLLDHG